MQEEELDSAQDTLNHIWSLFSGFSWWSFQSSSGPVFNRALFPVQDLALSTDEALPVYNRCAVHALAAAYLNLICQLTTVPAFCQHIHEVWSFFVYFIHVSEYQEHVC